MLHITGGENISMPGELPVIKPHKLTLTRVDNQKNFDISQFPDKNSAVSTYNFIIEAVKNEDKFVDITEIEWLAS